MGNGKKLQLLTIPLDVDRGTDALRESNAAYGIFMLHVDNDEFSAFRGRETRGFVWFPKSQIQEYVNRGDEVSFWCPEWLIVSKGCEAFIDTSHEPGLFD
jgi:hypothetical protein